MASTMALFAASRGLQTGAAMGEAFAHQTFAKLKSDAIDMRMREISARADSEIKNIYAQGEKVVAEQTAAFTKGGVEISGSAMTAISDTLANAAEAAYVRRREADYELIGLAMERAQMDYMASNEALLMNLTSAGLQGAMGYQTDKFKYGRSSLRDRGASGIGSSYALNYSAGQGSRYA